MIMKRQLIILGVAAYLVVGSTLCNAQRLTILNFENTPIEQLLEFYATFSAMTVTVIKADYPRMTLKSAGRLNDEQTEAAIFSCLASNRVTVTKSANGIKVAPIDRQTEARHADNGDITIIAPADSTRPARDSRPGSTSQIGGPRDTNDDNLRRAFQDYRKELKRQGLPQPELTPKEQELGVQKE